MKFLQKVLKLTLGIKEWLLDVVLVWQPPDLVSLYVSLNFHHEQTFPYVLTHTLFLIQEPSLARVQYVHVGLANCNPSLDNTFHERRDVSSIITKLARRFKHIKPQINFMSI